jgi:hypothetical protein
MTGDAWELHWYFDRKSKKEAILGPYTRRMLSNITADPEFQNDCVQTVYCHNWNIAQQKAVNTAQMFCIFMHR